MEKRKIILDCDPGHDDAIAMMMAAKHPAIDLLGITIVAGNQTLDKTLINGLNVCQKLEINVPVYAGMPQPIMRKQIVADNIHGETGLDGPVFEPLTRQDVYKRQAEARQRNADAGYRRQRSADSSGAERCASERGGGS